MRLKQTLLFFLIILSSSFCHAQLRNFGVKGGLNSSGIGRSDIEGSKKRIGYHVGIVGYLKISNTWTFQPELVYSDQGYNLKKVRCNMRYFTLPLLFKYNYQDFFFDFGPQVSVLFNANQVGLGNNRSKVNITSELNNIDLSLTSGIGFMVNENIGLEGRYVFGLSNASAYESVTIYNNALQISIFYIFR